MDWATRHVLAWRLSNTMDAGFCVEALNEALSRYGNNGIHLNFAAKLSNKVGPRHQFVRTFLQHKPI